MPLRVTVKRCSRGAALGSALFIVVITGLHSGLLSAATGEKRIESDPQHMGDAVIVTKVMWGDEEVQCGLVANERELQPVTPILAGDDWVEHLVIYVFNRTNKTIAFGQVGLWFPETGDGKSPQTPMTSYKITVGRIPDSMAISVRTGKAFSQPPDRKPLNLAPGQTLILHVSDYIDEVKSAFNGAFPFAAASRVIIRRSPFIFDDGMLWSPGEGFALPDPQRPGQWTRFDPRYFPGDERANWPPKTK